MDESCGSNFFEFLFYGFVASKKDQIKYCKCCGDGDIVEMRIDFKLLTLKFKVNNDDYGVAVHIDPGKYKASINMSSDKSRYILESYQKTY